MYYHPVPYQGRTTVELQAGESLGETMPRQIEHGDFISRDLHPSPNTQYSDP
jgi:hypothetical protein